MTAPAQARSLAERIVLIALVPICGFLAVQVWRTSTVISGGVPPTWFKEEVADLKMAMALMQSSLTDVRIMQGEMASNRFTSQDGMDRFLEVWQEIAQIRRDLAAIEDRQKK